jgi:hypothetical protein
MATTIWTETLHRCCRLWKRFAHICPQAHSSCELTGKHSGWPTCGALRAIWPEKRNLWSTREGWLGCGYCRARGWRRRTSEGHVLRCRGESGHGDGSVGLVKTVWEAWDSGMKASVWLNGTWGSCLCLSRAAPWCHAMVSRGGGTASPGIFLESNGVHLSWVPSKEKTVLVQGQLGARTNPGVCQRQQRYAKIMTECDERKHGLRQQRRVSDHYNGRAVVVLIESAQVMSAFRQKGGCQGA